METINPIGSFNDLVFENRNKEYGAYALRKSYDDNVLKAMLIALVFILSLITLSKIDFTTEKETIPPIRDTNKLERVRAFELPQKKEKIKVKSGQQKNNTIKTNNTTYKIIDTLLLINRKIDTASAMVGSPQGYPRFSKDTFPSLGAGSTKGSDYPPQKEPVSIPDVNAEFPGGETEMYKFIYKNLHYLSEAFEIKNQGTAYITFIVDANGKIKNVSSLTKHSYGLSDAVIRVIKMMPDWKPAIYKGEPVPVVFNLPVKFKLK